ncbi:MAG: phage major capsid protein [Clostridium sp.]|nr:phage major capsid protein [Clostridium sp.]
MNELQKLIEKRKGIVARIDGAKTDEELDAIKTELRKVDMQITEEKNRIEEEKRNNGYIDENGQSERTRTVNDDENNDQNNNPEKRSADYIPGVGFRAVDGVDLNNEKEFRNVGNEKVEVKELEKRGEIWKGNNREERAVVLDDTILIPKHKSNTVNALPFNEVSSILDLVKITPFPNGDSYEVPFEYETGEGDYTEEVAAGGTGGEYHEVGVKFDSSKIKRTKLTTYSEISKEFLKTPSANYAERVQVNVVKSIYKKIAKDIVVGVGGDSAIQGILTQPEKVTNDKSQQRDNRVIDKDIEVTELGFNTINDIVFAYGGENDVEEGQVLLMNKMTLNEFAKMRDSNGNKAYDIKTYGATFTIDGIRGVFSAHIKPFSTAEENDYFMAYGSPQAYELALFGAIDVEESIHYKFRQGLISYRADQFIGGNLTAYKSWIRVKKGAALMSLKGKGKNKDEDK